MTGPPLKGRAGSQDHSLAKELYVMVSEEDSC